MVGLATEATDRLSDAIGARFEALGYRLAGPPGAEAWPVAAGRLQWTATTERRLTPGITTRFLVEAVLAVAVQPLSEHDVHELVGAAGRIVQAQAAGDPRDVGKAAIPIILCEQVSGAEPHLGRKNWHPFPYTFVAPALVDVEKAETYFASGWTMAPAVRVPLARIIRTTVADAVAASAAARPPG